MPRQRARRVARRRRARAPADRGSAPRRTRDPGAAARARRRRPGVIWPASPTTAPCCGPSAQTNRRRLPGDEERLAQPASKRTRHAERAAQLLDDALDVEEVDLARAAGPVVAGAADPVHATATAARLAVGREARPDLEQPDVAPSVAAVVRDRVDEARQERRPERVELGGQRVARQRERESASRAAPVACSRTTARPPSPR